MTLKSRITALETAVDDRTAPEAEPAPLAPWEVSRWLRGLFWRQLDVARGVFVTVDPDYTDVAAVLNDLAADEDLVLLTEPERSVFFAEADAGRVFMSWCTHGPTERHYFPWPAWPGAGKYYPPGAVETCSAVHRAALIWARQTGNAVPGELSGDLSDVYTWLTAPERTFLEVADNE